MGLSSSQRRWNHRVDCRLVSGNHVSPPAPAAGADATFDPAEFAIRATLEETHYWHLHRRRVILEAVAGRLPAAGSLLDLGCGIGTVALFLNRHGVTTDCSDLFDEALTVARRRFRDDQRVDEQAVRFFRHDLTRDAPPPRRGYAGVLLLDVIEHLPDDVAALRRAAEFLAPGEGSFLVVTVPAFPCLWSPWDEIERHRRRYTRASLVRAIGRAGFAPRRLSHFFLPLFAPAGLVKGLRTVRDALRPRRSPPQRITDLVETHEPRLATALLRPMLALERRRLARHDLPFGTSLLCIAERRREAA